MGGMNDSNLDDTLYERLNGFFIFIQNYVMSGYLFFLFVMCYRSVEAQHRHHIFWYFSLISLYVYIQSPYKLRTLNICRVEMR